MPRLVGEGWPRLAEVAPAAAAVVTPLARDPGPLVEALEGTPQTFVHSNWKLDNLGTDDRRPDGAAGLGAAGPRRAAVRPGLVPGHQLPAPAAGQGGRDRRLPRALEEHGISTEAWWDRQLALCLLGALVQFGWEKALGGYDEELAWWETQAVEAARC